MVLAVPKVFIMNSLLDSKLSDSHFIINPSSQMSFLSMSKNRFASKNTENILRK